MDEYQKNRIDNRNAKIKSSFTNLCETITLQKKKIGFYSSLHTIKMIELEGTVFRILDI